MSLHLDMNKGTVKQDLAQLPEQMLDYAFEVLLQQAELMKGLAQVYVRVDTGSLRDSIRLERTAPSYHHHRIVRVRAGGYVTNPKTHRIVNYAVAVERRYPYMRPAWYQVRQGLAEMIKANIVQKVNQ